MPDVGGQKQNLISDIRHPTSGLQSQIKLPDQIVVVELGGGAALEGDAAVHDHVAAVGDADRLGEVLLGHQHGQAVAGFEFLDLVDGAAHQDRREADRRLVSNIRGASIIPRPSASICCSPPERLPASCWRRSSKRGKHSKQNSRFSLMRARAVARNAPSSKFSSTVSLGNSRRPSGTSAMPRSTISSVERPTRSCLVPSISTVTVPALGRTMPMMHFMSVLLPLPLVPSSTTVSPALTVSDTSSSTRTAP